MYKIAFLFLTIGNIYHEDLWKRFFHRQEEKYSIYIHSKTKQKKSIFKKHEIKAKIPTTWQNTMRAQIALLKEALRDPDNQKFVFLSESTIPLQTFDYVYKTLTADNLSRFDYYPNYHKDRNFKPIPFNQQYKNSQWVVLNRKHAQLMINDQRYLDIITNYYFDNEHYPSTFLANQNLLNEIVKCDTTLVIWAGQSPHPHTFKNLKEDKFTEFLIKAIKSKQFLFARKISTDCDLKPIYKYLQYIKN